jgi:glucuronoarabinoxylan endo-1,4-beta-xylanase
MDGWDRGKFHQRECEHTMKKLLLLLLLPLSLSAQTAYVNWTNVHQVIDGFGASDAGQGASMPSAQQTFFFGTASGDLGLSLLRVGLTDGSQDPGSCASVSSSCAGVYVSDMQAALADGARIYASPWTPPAAYKTNSSATCQGGSGSGSLSSGSYGSYATWMANFSLSLSSLESINLYAVSVQNEPDQCTAYDSAEWSSASIDTFIKSNLGPTFSSDSISTLIFMPEVSSYGNTASVGGTCGTDSSCTGYVGGYNWHDYDDASNTPYPSGWTAGKKWWETEVSQVYGSYGPGCSSSSGFNTSISDALCWASIIDNRLQNGANAWLYWELACHQQAGGATCPDDSSLTDNAAGSYNPAKRAYVLGHYGKYARPGYYRIDATHAPQSGVTVSAYQNTSGGNLVIIATNDTGSSVSQTFTIQNAPTFTTLTPVITSATQNLATLSNVSVSSQSFTYTLPAQSIITFAGTGSGSTTYSLTVTATNGSISGGTNCTVGTTSLAANSSISCPAATPNVGYTFANYSGTGACSGVSGSTATCTLTSNATITANFAATGCGNYTASSDSESAVNSAINGPNHVACNGDTISIPCSGTQSVTWSSTLTVTANITLTALGGSPNSGPSTFGAGTNCLTITSTTSILFELDPTYSATNNTVTLQDITLVPGSGAYTPIHISGTGTSSGMPLARIDNIIFGNGTAQWQYGTGSNTGEFDIIENNVFGVADHNTTVSGSQNAFISVNLTSYLGVGLYGDNSWAQPDSTGGTNNFFIENNQFSQLLWPIVENEQTYPNIGGGRAVTRFNHITASGIFFLTGGHGNDTDGRPRSMRTNETYANTVNCINGSEGNACYDFFSWRGGSGLGFGNTATLGSGAVWNEIGSLATYRIDGDGWAFSNVGSCGGAMSGNAYGPFDQNDGVTYYSGMFASGTSGVTLVASGSPGWGTNQWSNPSPFYPYSVWDVTQGWVSIIQSNGSNNLNVSQAPHGYINGGTAINAAPGDSFQITRSKSCLDGGARGAGLLLTGSAAVLASTNAVGPANEVLDPVYEWDDTVPAVQYGDQIGLSYSAPAQLNREVFTDNSLGSPHAQTSPTSPFNGSSGVGFGTLANRPATCTANSVSGAPGTGYWATDQGNWNQSGLACAPNQIGGGCQGVLYKCTSAGTWPSSASYIPAQYPYPLIGGTPQAATPVISPVTGSYSSTQTVSITDTTPSSTIHYTTDGSTPTLGSTTYTGTFLASVTTTVQAIAAATGYTPSNVGQSIITIGGTPQAAAPTASPAGGTYASTQTVTLSDTTPSSTITYGTASTSAGCTPGTTYSTPITVSSTGYVCAYANAAGYLQSSTASLSYIISGGVFYLLTVTASNGLVTGTNCGTDTYPPGTFIGPCTPVANPGYMFSGWSNISGSAVCTGTVVPCAQFALGAPSGFTANFVATPVPSPLNLNGQLIAKQVKMQ